jgi:hypothetical protein
MTKDSFFVRFCSKLGIGELQLSTLILSLFFLLLGLQALPAHAAGFFALSQLTFGACIGSYVQQNRLASKLVQSDSSTRDK